MQDTEKFGLRIYESGDSDPSFVITSDTSFILPRVGDFINTLGLGDKHERLLKVIKVTHWFYDNNSFLSTQMINIMTESAS